MKPLTVREKASADIDRALDHYVREAPAAAPKLLDALRATFKQIQTFPRAGSARFAHELGMAGVRHRSTRRFPYLVFYVEGPSAIFVIRVLHQHRDLPKALDE